MTVWFPGLIHVLPSWLGGELLTIALQSSVFADTSYQGPHHGSVMVTNMSQLLHYYSFNAFGIVSETLGMLLYNRCISFIALII